MNKFLENIAYIYPYFTKSMEALIFFTKEGLVLMEIVPDCAHKDTYKVTGYFTGALEYAADNPAYANYTKYRQSPKDVVDLIETYCPIYQNYIEGHTRFDYDAAILMGMGFAENKVCDTLSRFIINEDDIRVSVLPPFIDPDFYLCDEYSLEVLDEKKHRRTARFHSDSLEGVLNYLKQA